jgi:exopolyphosphatase/guanosine-5'-triphosphate,3'-diphosphate pyrophosphatase
MAILLRIAESLDRSHTSVVQTVTFEESKKNSVILRMDCARTCQLELWGIQNQRRVFEKTFKQRLEIKSCLPEDQEIQEVME